MDPADSDSLPQLHHCDACTNLVDISNYLVTQDHWKMRWRRSALDFVKLGVTYAADSDPYSYFIRLRLRYWKLNQL
jgi:hypothetical protein